jgi:hypothetical protein
MLETVGILAIWVTGGVISFYAPLLSCGWWANTGDGLSDLAAGIGVGSVVLAVYLISTIIYFVAT